MSPPLTTFWEIAFGQYSLRAMSDFRVLPHYSDPFASVATDVDWSLRPLSVTVPSKATEPMCAEVLGADTSRTAPITVWHW